LNGLFGLIHPVRVDPNLLNNYVGDYKTDQGRFLIVGRTLAWHRSSISMSFQAAPGLCWQPPKQTFSVDLQTARRIPLMPE
jgi:hypothetical protein